MRHAPCATRPTFMKKFLSIALCACNFCAMRSAPKKLRYLRRAQNWIRAAPCAVRPTFMKSTPGCWKGGSEKRWELNYKSWWKWGHGSTQPPTKLNIRSNWKLNIVDTSNLRIGKNMLVNRLKILSNFIPQEWLNLSMSSIKSDERISILSWLNTCKSVKACNSH